MSDNIPIYIVRGMGKETQWILISGLYLYTAVIGLVTLKPKIPKSLQTVW